MDSAYLWRIAQLAIKKKQKNFSLPDHQLAENFIFDFYERTKKEWKQIYRNYSDGYIHVFFIDHSRHKTVNETTCRTPSANACQLCSYELKSFPTAMTIFWGYQNFLIFLTKYFWPLLNSPYLIFQLPFCKISVNKTV